MKMPNGLLIATLLAAGLTTPLAAQETTTEESAEEAADAAPVAPIENVTADTVVATVNGAEITLGQMIIARNQLPPQYQELPDDVLFTGVLDQLIQQQVLAETMTEEPLRVTIALENERRLLLAGEVVQSIVDDAVTDEAIQAAYDMIFEGTEGGVEYNAAHILVATEEEAQAVLARLEEGEEFAALAQELSTDLGSGANGGDLGWFSDGMMVEPFEVAVKALEVGGISAPVETQFGWHVLILNETREQAPPPLDAVRGEIESQVREEAIQTALIEMTEAADVTRPETGAFDPAILLDLDLLVAE